MFSGWGKKDSETEKLLECIVKGDVKGCEQHIQEANLNHSAPGFYPPLHEAVAAGNQEIVTLLLEHCASVNTTVKHKQTDTDASPLSLAVEQKDAAMTKLLLEHGADVTQKYSKKQNIHHLATRNNASACARVLLEKSDKSVNAKLLSKKDKLNQTPFLAALERVQGEVLMLYLVAGATTDTAKINDTFRIALEQTVKDEDLWTRFIEVHLGVQHEYNAGQGCLHLAVRHRRPDVLALLMKKRAPVNARDNLGKTPLHYAVERKDMESALLLLNANADRTLKDKEKHTCLHYAVETKQEEIVLALLKDQDLTQPYITEEFLDACHKADVDMITVLLKAGVTGTNEGKETPLHIVAAKKDGSVELVKLLIKQGLDTKTRRKDGGTVLHSAVEGGNLEVISAILDTSPEIAATNEAGQTVLHTLVKSNTLQKVDGQELVEGILERAKICKKLVSSGVPVMAFDAEGKSALSYALEEQDHTITKVLVTHYSETQPLDTKGNLLIHELVRYDHRALDDQIKSGKIKNLEAVSTGDEAEGGVALTPLVMAALQHKANAFEVLVKHGADITQRHDSRSMLKLLLEMPNDITIDATLKEMLKRDGIREYLEDGQPDNKIPMQLAFGADRQGCVDQLAAAGVPKPDVWTYDFSQLILECDVEGIKQKLSLFNIDLAACEPNPLRFILENMSGEEAIEMCELFVKKGLSTDMLVEMAGMRDHLYQHAIRCALMDGDVGLFELLLVYSRSHVDLSKVYTKDGNTILHMCLNLDPEGGKALIKKVLEEVPKEQAAELLNIRNKRGETPLWMLWATSEPGDSGEFILDLVQRGADPSVRSNDTSHFPETSILELALLRSPPLCSFLLLVGADPTGLQEVIQTPKGAIRICKPGAEEAMLEKRPAKPVLTLLGLERAFESAGMNDEFYEKILFDPSESERRRMGENKSKNKTETKKETKSGGGRGFGSSSTSKSTSKSSSTVKQPKSYLDTWGYSGHACYYEDHHDDSSGGGGSSSNDHSSSNNYSSSSGGDGGGGGWSSGGGDSGWGSSGGGYSGGGSSSCGGDGGGGGWDD